MIALLLHSIAKRSPKTSQVNFLHFEGWNIIIIMKKNLYFALKDCNIIKKRKPHQKCKVDDCIEFYYYYCKGLKS